VDLRQRIQRANDAGTHDEEHLQLHVLWHRGPLDRAHLPVVLGVRIRSAADSDRRHLRDDRAILADRASDDD